MTEVRDLRVVPDRLEYWSARRPAAEFVDAGTGWLGFAEVQRRSAAVASGLAARGIGRGDRVAILLPNRVEYVLAIFALARLGAIQVPVNAFLKGGFLSHQLRDCGVAAVIADGPGLAAVTDVQDDLPELRLRVRVGGGVGPEVAFAELERSLAGPPVVPLEPSDPLAILYTSGTTGAPKGCLLSHGYLCQIPHRWFELDWFRADDRLFTAAPLYHVAGQGFCLMGALMGGMPLAIAGEFSARSFLRQAAGVDATAVFGVGPMAMAMLATEPGPADREHRLRLAMFPPLAPEPARAFAGRFGVTTIGEGYGQTECTPICLSPLHDQALVPGALGAPNPYLRVAVLDDAGNPVAPGTIGEIVVRPGGPEMMFSGYWGRPEATAETWRGLWHHTGDAGYADERGYLVFADRKKDAMRRRGENISSIELEAAILRHPAIAAVATHGVPSPLGEDDVKAWIVLEPGASVAPAELHAFFASALPYFAVPRYVQLTDALPVNALGRVQKFVLRDRPNEGAWDFEELGLTIERERRR